MMLRWGRMGTKMVVEVVLLVGVGDVLRGGVWVLGAGVADDASLGEDGDEDCAGSGAVGGCRGRVEGDVGGV